MGNWLQRGSRVAPSTSLCYEAEVQHTDGWNYRVVIAAVDSMEEAREVLQEEFPGAQLAIRVVR